MVTWDISLYLVVQELAIAYFFLTQGFVAFLLLLGGSGGLL